MATMSRPLPQEQNDAASLHREAVRFLQSGKFNEGIAKLKKAAKANPQSANILKDLGTACWQAGRPAEADKYYAEALKLGPQNAAVLSAAGAFRHEQGDSEKAEKLLLEAVRLRPEDPEALNNLGIVFLDTERLDKAEKCIDRALAFNPLWVNALYNKSRILGAQKNYAQAEVVLKRVLQMAPGHAPAITLLGLLLRETGKAHEAVPLMKKAVEIFPAGQEGWYALIGLYEFMARLEDAEKAIEEARKYISETPNLIFLEAKIARRRGGAKDALAIMEKYRPGMRKTPRNFNFFYELGSMYDKIGNIDEAFSNYNLANELWLQNSIVKEYDRAGLPGRIDKRRAVFTPEWIKTWSPAPRATNQKPEPVFLVGFPRSGTTLLGQIVSSHAKIDVADECPALKNVMHAIGNETSDYLPGLPRLSAGDLETLRENYIKDLVSYGRDASRPFIIDKMPLHLMDVGLIYRLFPDAKFILALRHPCDSVLSCFMQAFSPNPAMVQLTDIENSARFYDQVFGLWEHYRQVLPLNVHAVRYEDVVGDFRSAIEPLLNFIGVEWSDAVLEHDKNAKARVQTKTPSYSQVTEKIYTTSRGRWHGYRKYMEPALPVLAPWAKKFGYDIL
ncbi:MAG: sulfotransferase [Proteobacteria bacterium]|nr:sulfotransferase [Pseudomonadota bacterium]